MVSSLPTSFQSSEIWKCCFCSCSTVSVCVHSSQPRSDLHQRACRLRHIGPRWSNCLLSANTVKVHVCYDDICAWFIHDSVSAGAAFESLPFDFWATVAEMFSVTDDSPLVCRWGRFNSLNENASGVHALMHICGKCGVQMCCSDIHFISWDISTTSLLLSTHSHTNTRMQTLRHASTNHPHSPLVESRKCGSVKVTGYLGWLSFPNSLSISRLQFHCCGCPHCLACCLISESHPTTLQATRHRETNKKN